jgi:hypothetical protein
MQQDYTINDAWHDGFECGLLYILRYIEEEYGQVLSTDDIARLAAHLESKKVWKTGDEWEQLLYGR